MDLQGQKLELIQWLAGINNPELIEKLLQLKNTASIEEETLIQESIDRGLKDVEAGRVHSHSEVKKLYEKWL